MSSTKFSDDFKRDAVAQITERGYLAVVIDLFSRRVVGWSMQSRQTTDVVLQALLMATWRRKPKAEVLIHSDQGSQFTSMDWVAFLYPSGSGRLAATEAPVVDHALWHALRSF